MNLKNKIANTFVGVASPTLLITPIAIGFNNTAMMTCSGAIILGSTAILAANDLLGNIHDKFTINSEYIKRGAAFSLTITLGSLMLNQLPGNDNNDNMVSEGTPSIVTITKIEKEPS